MLVTPAGPSVGDQERASSPFGEEATSLRYAPYPPPGTYTELGHHPRRVESPTHWVGASLPLAGPSYPLAGEAYLLGGGSYPLVRAFRRRVRGIQERVRALGRRVRASRPRVRASWQPVRAFWRLGGEVQPLGRTIREPVRALGERIDDRIPPRYDRRESR